MRKFDHKDFVANPGKYRLFSTAIVATNIITNNGENDISEGAVVGIKWIADARNQMYRRTEPVYNIIGTDRNLYANTLADFVL